MPIGVVGVGWLAQEVGATSVMTGGGALAMVVVLVALLPAETRQMRQPSAETAMRRDLAVSEVAA